VLCNLLGLLFRTLLAITAYLLLPIKGNNPRLDTTLENLLSLGLRTSHADAYPLQAATTESLKFAHRKYVFEAKTRSFIHSLWIKSATIFALSLLASSL